jgi:hypothetical protein
LSDRLGTHDVDKTFIKYTDDKIGKIVDELVECGYATSSLVLQNGLRVIEIKF